MKVYIFNTPKGDFKATAENIGDAFEQVKKKDLPSLTWADCKNGTVIKLPTAPVGETWPTPAA